MYKFACKFSDEIIFYFDECGNKYVASGGDLAWRLNNPGLVRSHSHFSRSNGSIGHCGCYAIFPDPQQGRKALLAWLHAKKYYDSTLKTIASYYQENSPEVFLNRISSFVKISPDKKLKFLTKQEFDCLVLGIEKFCGYALTGSESFSLLPKIIAKIECGGDREDLYLIGDAIVLSKEEALQWIFSHRLDAVIVYEKNNKTYLRSRPNYSFQKIRIYANGLLPSVLEWKEIDTLVRITGEKKPEQCIWSFINGIDNTEEEALASAALISQAAGGERVLSMPNDTIWKGIDLCVCFALKLSADTPLVAWTVKFLKYLLSIANLETKLAPVIVFAHSQGAIYLEHALELLPPHDRSRLRIFTFGGGSFIAPGMSHSDSHNYASAADYVCRFGSPYLQYLALKRYHELKNGLSEQQVIHQLAYADALLDLDSIDPETIAKYTKNREQYYEKEFSKIRNITILDPDPGSNWKHEFSSQCYQATIRSIIKHYKNNE